MGQPVYNIAAEHSFLLWQKVLELHDIEAFFLHAELKNSGCTARKTGSTGNSTWIFFQSSLTSVEILWSCPYEESHVFYSVLFNFLLFIINVLLVPHFSHLYLVYLSAMTRVNKNNQSLPNSSSCWHLSATDWVIRYFFRHMSPSIFIIKTIPPAIFTKIWFQSPKPSFNA